MKKISDLGITGKKLLLEGAGFLVVGILLLYFGPSFPELMLRLFLLFLAFRELWNLLFRWFSKAAAKDPLWMNAGKLVLYTYLAGNQFFLSLPISIVSILMGLNEVMNAGISGVTYYIYLKDGIRPRLRLLWDTIWLSVVGVATLIALGGDGKLQMFFLSLYLIGHGISNLRDGWFFEAEVGKKVLRRHFRQGLPLVLAAIIPRVTLQKINDTLELNEGETASEIYDRAKENAEPNLEMFIHVTKDGFGAIGHVDICYKGRIISYGNYDTNSERLFGTMGDGVLFSADREKYIEFCKRENHKTLLGYGLALSPEQLEAIDEEIEKLMSLTVPWDPPQTVKPAQPGIDKVEAMYAYKLKQEADALLYKFVSSKFKTYFVMSTNCVLLADTIVGKAGTDILSARGFISPGTYQDYLDKEFERPHSLVVTKRVYQ
ncbi:hypothetical protein ACWOA5_06095 [Granulicatella adiacens]